MDESIFANLIALSEAGDSLQRLILMGSGEAEKRVILNSSPEGFTVPRYLNQ